MREDWLERYLKLISAVMATMFTLFFGTLFISGVVMVVAYAWQHL